MKSRRRGSEWVRAGGVAMACLMALGFADAADEVDVAPDRVYRRELLHGAEAPVTAAPAGLGQVLAQPQPSARQPGMSAPMTLDLRQINVNSVLRLISEVAQANIVATQAAGERELSLYMAQTTAGEALDAVARVTGLWVRWRPSSRTWMVMTAQEYQRELTVFGEERTEVLHLRHHNVVSAASTLRSLFGERVVLQDSVEEALGETMKVTDLRRSDERSSRRHDAGNRSQSAEATAAGVVRTQRGGTARAGRQDEGSQQLVAAAAEAQATTSQAEAALRGQEAPLYVTYNRQHNLLILRSGDDRVLTQARQLIRQIDLPARQVLLEMRIIQVRLDDEFHRAFDMEFFGTGAATGIATTATGQALNPLTGATVARNSDGAVISPRQLGALGMYDHFDRNTGLFQFLSNRIRLRLQLLEEKGNVQTLARPLLLASNNEPARLFIGEEVVLVTGASAQTTTGTTGATNTVITAETEQRDIGTTLVIHPRINDDRTVTMTIDQESSERIVGGTTIPLATGDIGDGVLQYPIDTVNTSSVQAVAQAKDGLTIAVGGMIKINKTNKTANVPGLSKIPLIGELFKRDEKVDERTELLLIITPYVLESTEEAERVTQRVGGTVMKSAVLRLNPDSLEEPGRQARTLAGLVLEGMDEADPVWAMDPAVRRESVQSWTGADWPGGGLRSNLRGAWHWGGLTAVALEITHDSAERLATLVPASLPPGTWLATAMDETPRAVAGGGFARRLVLVADVPWTEVAPRLRP